MIQVCGQCGTRWNVRDRQRVWCPKCHGALLAPSAPAPDPQWSSGPVAPHTPQAGPRLARGYRWIAVRPGQPPSVPRRRRSLGPTPHYTEIPRWGLVERFDPVVEQPPPPRSGPSAAVVRATLITTMVVLAFATLVHVVRYVLLLVNRTVLLHPLIAGVATWLGVAASVLAMFTVVASAVTLTNWLIARRATAFARRGIDDPRPVWMQRVGCLVPFLNLFWAPIFAIELAAVEGRLDALRRPIVVWWIAWVISTVVSVFSIATSFTSDAQGIADNTVTTTFAYLLALAALALVTHVFLGFERAPLQRTAKRYVIIASDIPTAPADAPAPGRDADEPVRVPVTERETPVPVEPQGQNPAA